MKTLSGTYGSKDEPVQVRVDSSGHIQSVWTARQPTIRAEAKIDSGMAHQAYWNGVRDGYIGGILLVMLVGWIAVGRNI